MMLQSKSPNRTVVFTDTTLHSNSASYTFIEEAQINEKNVQKFDAENESNKDQQSSLLISQTLSSSQPKLTHRRGYSHGSYSTLNPTPSSSSHLSANNSSLNYLGTSSRNNIVNNTIGVVTEAQTLGDRRNLYSNNFSLSHLNSSGYADQPFTKSNMRAILNDSMNQSDENQTPVASVLPQNEEIKRAITHIEQKIRKIKKAIAEEQYKCNDNVNEYLKLSSKPQTSQKMKTVFEKNNQKSSQKIIRYQKKLLQYNQELQDIRDRGVYHRHTRERLRDVGTNIKEGITGLSGGVIEGIRSGIHTAGETVITKPKEFFKRSTVENHLNEKSIEQEQTSGLGSIFPDDYHQQTTGNSGIHNSNSHSHSHSTKCTSEEDSSSITSESGPLGSNSQNNSAHLTNSPFRLKIMKNYFTAADIDQLRCKIDEKTQDFLRLGEEIEALKNQFQSDCTILNQTLQDEKYRVERLEEQLNDLTELHQKEIENLKQTISDLEEKIQYQTEERHRDVHEMLESFQTRISRMEHQQHQHLQQLVNLDSLDNSNARALVLKLINVLLTILQVILLLVATIANILAPFLQTRMRIFTSVFVIILFTFVFRHWPHLSTWAQNKIYENCIYVLSWIPFFPDSSLFDDTKI